MNSVSKSTNIVLSETIAKAIDASSKQVDAAIELLDGGATVPFISRYRKEITGGLTDSQLRSLEDKLGYLRELEDRKQSIISAIDEQGKLTPVLVAQINSTATKAELEDIYLPYKKKRRTKGQLAIEAGLEPLADLLWNDPMKIPEEEATAYIHKTDDPKTTFADEKAVLDGARYILMERFAEDASLIARLRDLLQNQAYLCSKAVKGKETEGAKFRDYFDHQEPYARVPGHRALAMFRGRTEGFLALSLLTKQADEYGDDAAVSTIGKHTDFTHEQRAADDWRAQVVSWTWRVKLSLHLESELFTELRNRADAEAISVFSANLQDLLLAAPAGPRPTLGLDPGYRSGVKTTVIDSTGKVVDFATIYPHKPQGQWREALNILAKLCLKHSVELIAIGNGTASRETEKLADELMSMVRADPKASTLKLTKVPVSEAGASVYSASKVAEDEFPDLDVTIRGAVSIARRLQDPLAELVKIDPKAIGVGQYQHDVSQNALAKSLEATVEDCVNAVGVDLDTASAALLTYVAGLTPTLASNIVSYRDEQGVFKSRKDLSKVPRLGPKAFEQAAGFLRIPNGTNPLDASGVHPESYPVVERIIKKLGIPLDELVGNVSVLRKLDAEQFTDDQFGVPTVKDIITELEKPGRDPRPEFRAVLFAEDVNSMSDLNPNQVLEGKVTNVTAFGAFVDIGVHQDGLVHISALSDTFVKDPRDVVKAGDIVKVKVMAVDIERKRIGLSMRLSDDADEHGENSQRVARQSSGSARPLKHASSGPSGSRKSASPTNKSQVGKRHKASQENTSESALALSLKAALDAKK